MTYEEALDHFAEVTEKDILDNSPGKLWIGGIICRAMRSSQIRKNGNIAAMRAIIRLPLRLHIRIG